MKRVASLIVAAFLLSGISVQAAASIFDVESAFSTEYREALLFALHKRGKADAYAVFLYRDPERAKPIIREALSALSFVR